MDSIKSEFYINKILMFGNDVTNKEVILRELRTKENSNTNIKILQEDANRLYNLGLFNKVDVLPVNIGNNKFNLLITVIENFYILPLPQAGFKEGDIKKFWAGMDFLWKNFRGWNETLDLNFGIGYEPFINAFYANPWLGKEDHFFSTVSMSYSKNFNRNVFNSNTQTNIYTKDDLEKFTVNSYGSNVTIGKFFDKFTNINTSIGFNIISVSEYAPGRTISSDGTDSYFSFQAGINLDTRDLFNYTTSGNYLDLKYIKYGLFHHQIDLNRVVLDVRKFIPLNFSKNYSVCFATRLISSNAIGKNMPVYLRESFGFDKIIRGWKDNVFDGENLLGFFNELRIPVINPFWVKGKDHILLKKFSLSRNFSYRYGLYLTLFYDVGNSYNRGDNIFNVHFRSGFGSGLNIILPFDIIGRIDLAARKQNSKYYSQIIFSLNSSF